MPKVEHDCSACEFLYSGPAGVYPCDKCKAYSMWRPTYQALRTQRDKLATYMRTVAGILHGWYNGTYAFGRNEADVIANDFDAAIKEVEASDCEG